MVPILVRFDPLSVMTFGLIAFSNPGQPRVNGIGLVTRFVAGEIWDRCCDDVTTNWVDSYPQPVTVWTEVTYE